MVSLLAPPTYDGERFKEPGEFADERHQANQERDLAFAKIREVDIDPTQL